MRPYSHTSLSLAQLCLRRWYYRYELGIKEPPSLPASYSTWMIHKPIETWVTFGSDPSVDWEASYGEWWSGLRGELDLPDDFDDPLYNLANAKRALGLYVKNPIPGKVLAVEERSEPMALPNGESYISIPDFLIRNERGLSTVDIKMTSRFSQKPLSPFDDQFLGQAIPLGADGFYRVTIMGDKGTGKLTMLTPEWQPVDEVLKQEWIRETVEWTDIIGRLTMGGGVAGGGEICDLGGGSESSWPKNGEACYAFGRECPHRGRCEIGLVGKKGLG